MRAAKRALQLASNFYDRAARKCRTLLVFPFRLWFVNDRFVPEKPVLNATSGLQLARLFFCDSIEFLRHEMMRIPELFRADIRNSPQRAPARRAPVGCQYWLPHYQHAEPRVRVPLQYLFGCGGPPQTCRSGRRQQQNQPRTIDRFIERVLELREIAFGERCKSLLPGWHGGPYPQIGSSRKRKRREKTNGEGLPIHLAVPAKRSAINPAISCGNKIIPMTSATADQSNTALR